MNKRWVDCKNILCIRTDNMGDVIMTSPAIKSIKETSTGRRVTLLTSSSGKIASSLLPFIDETIFYDFPWMNIQAHPAAINEAIKDLGNENFDGAVIFTVYSQSPLPAAMLCKMAGIPKIAAYCRENPYGMLTDWLPDNEPLFEIKHEVVRQIDLVRYLGFEVTNNNLFVHVDEETERTTWKLLDKEGLIKGKNYIVVHPGVSESRRRFSIDQLADAIGLISRYMDYQFVLTGVEKEKHLTEKINERLGGYGIDMAGKLNLAELSAIIKNASLLISNNTGPVHIAAALKTPVVVLYAMTNPQHLPWNVPYVALPFEVPENERSRNVIIKFAHEKAYKDKHGFIQSRDIADACQSLIQSSGVKEKSGLYK